jgi:hypothetical protein
MDLLFVLKRKLLDAGLYKNIHPLKLTKGNKLQITWGI